MRLRAFELALGCSCLPGLIAPNRNVLSVHPRDDRAMPLRGVFSTRSQDRPNPIGVHRVTVVSILDPLRFQVRDLEAFDGTAIIDVKAALEGLIE
jgi:tRNA (Thr-GGU) A37 N-methylase